MCGLQRNYDVIRNWERFETGPLTVLYFLKRKQTSLGGLNFYNSLCWHVVKWKEKQVGGFRLFLQTTLLIHGRLTRNSFLTGLYLKCGYEDLQCLCNKTNMPEGKPIQISSLPFSQALASCSEIGNRP